MKPNIIKHRFGVSFAVLVAIVFLYCIQITAEEERPYYPFNIEEVTIPLPKLSRDYKLAWVSDLHLITGLPFSPENIDVMPEYYDVIESRHTQTFVTPDGVRADELWPEIVNWLNAQALDAVILGGDMLDYYSKANMDAFAAEYVRIEAPVIYIRADHDYDIEYSGRLVTPEEAKEAHKALDGDDWERQHLEFPAFNVVGINESYRNVKSDVLYNVFRQMDRRKPTILATHVPYNSVVTASLEELSMSYRGKGYYWPSEVYKANDLQDTLLAEVYKPTSTICQVLAGHLHTEWDGMLTETVPEHIFGPAYAGNIGIINVVSE